MTRPDRRTRARLRRRVGTVAGPALVAGMVANGLRLRRRVLDLAVVAPGARTRAGERTERERPADASAQAKAPDTSETGSAGGVGSAGEVASADAGAGSERYVLIVVDGASVTADAVADAVAHADDHGLELLELVPGDLDADRALELARIVDPATYAGDRLAPGRGTAQAVLVDRALHDRLDARYPDRTVNEADIAELIVQAKLCSPVGCDLAVSGGLRAAGETPDRRRALLAVVHGERASTAVALPFVGLAALAAGAILAPWWALAAAGAYWFQPYLALWGGPLDRGLSPRRLAARPVTNVRRAARVAASTARPHGSLVAERGVDAEVARKQAEAARARWSELLAAGPELLFGPRRDDCPWCGATDLAPAAVVTDALQRRPGTFRFDRCGSCRHVFQNPALSPPVVHLYDEDRSTEPAADAARGWRAQPCPAGTVATRSRLVRRHIVGSEPASWLDVGPGDGRLCMLARRDFPRTRFAGLGAGDDAAAAARHGWLDEAHTGRLPEIARDLAGRFDVVSMCGHLERSRDPGAELAAARHALRPGGHLLVEAIDPDCRAGALLGRWWGSWSPHHQHLMPFANLCDRLRDEGFTVVATERRPAHRSVEVATATRLLLGRLGPEVGHPWLPPASTTGRLRHTVVAAAGTPLVGLATLVDRVSGGIVGRLPAGTNAYRVLARVGDRGPSAASGAAAPRAPAGRRGRT